ncbi:MAG TPA: sapC family protein [Rhodospirillaceae bacterium]|jgi:hypothetical protein|nr:SapC family protein [Alphaproteobacteria bacterium]HBH25795.1 sapC family protein [Rhodospirillaceae bacterium]
MANPQMPIFYSKPETLDPKQHADLALADPMSYAFAAKTNAITLTIAEMPRAALSFPVVFSPTGAPPAPVAILGLRDDENLFVDEAGTWLDGAYIPAYVRRYPFIFSRLPAEQEGAEPRLALAVDMVDRAVVTGGDKRFFEADESPSELTRNALDFCGQYQGAALQTEAFAEAVESAGLLKEHTQFVDIPGKHRVKFSGVRVVDEGKLATLDDGVFLDWRAKGWLPFLYTHLVSMGQWERLARLILPRLQPRERG